VTGNSSGEEKDEKFLRQKGRHRKGKTSIAPRKTKQEVLSTRESRKDSWGTKGKKKSPGTTKGEGRLTPKKRKQRLMEARVGRRKARKTDLGGAKTNDDATASSKTKRKPGF